MNETLTMKIDHKAFESLLTSYYRSSLNDQSAKVKINLIVKRVGFYESKIVEVKIILTRNVVINSFTLNLEEELTDEDIKEALSNKLNNEDFKIRDITFNSSIECHDYFERDGVPVFKGATISFTKNQIKKVLNNS